VKIFFNTRSNQRIVPEELDLGGAWCKEKIAGCEPADKWPFSDLERLWGAPDLER
jgi:hypothetical protein